MTSAAVQDVDLTYDPQIRGDAILDDLDRIRDITPAYWSEKSRCWLLTRHRDVSDALMRKLPVTNDGRMEPLLHLIPRDEWDARIPTLVKYSALWITSSEGERHARLRKLMMQALNRRIVEAMRPYARARAEALVDEAIAAGRIEFNEQISRMMTGDVLFTLLGMPNDVIPQLRNWATWLMEGVGSAVPTPERLELADKALFQMNAATKIELDKRRRSDNPPDDLITGLLQASESEDRLTEDELLAQMHVALVAGHDTTMNTLTLSVNALGRNPDAWAYVTANQDKMLDIVTELQRHVGMVGGQPKLVTEDFELGGETIRKGDLVAVMIAAANRDPQVFDNPAQLDFTRDNRASMTFAPGIHFCIGHMLAKLQLTEFLGAMARKVSRIEVLDDEPQFMPIWVFRGVYALNLRLWPA